MHEGGGRWVGSNKVVELKKKKEKKDIRCVSEFVSVSRVCCFFFFPEGLIFIIFLKKFAEQIKSVNWN